jgi:hypothetical protein
MAPLEGLVGVMTSNNGSNLLEAPAASQADVCLRDGRRSVMRSRKNANNGSASVP